MTGRGSHAIGLPAGAFIEAAAARAVAQVMRVGIAAFEEHTGDPVPADMQAIVRAPEEPGGARFPCPFPRKPL